MQLNLSVSRGSPCDSRAFLFSGGKCFVDHHAPPDMPIMDDHMHIPVYRQSVYVT